MKRTRILLADDHTMFCDTLSKSLLPDYEVVCVGDGRALLRIAAEFQPDVAILDIGMPVLNGLDAARELRNRLAGVKLIFLTMNTDPYIAKEALNIGASGYLLKSSPYNELLQAVHEVIGASPTSRRKSARSCRKFSFVTLGHWTIPKILAIGKSKYFSFLRRGDRRKKLRIPWALRSEPCGITSNGSWKHWDARVPPNSCCMQSSTP